AIAFAADGYFEAMLAQDLLIMFSGDDTGC
ncbi:MAG: hypothetical protein ACI80I_003311, partial [Akkermansiaceae bacterium]